MRTDKLIFLILQFSAKRYTVKVAMPAIEDTDVPKLELHPHDSTKFHEPHNPSGSEEGLKSFQTTAQI